MMIYVEFLFCSYNNYYFYFHSSFILCVIIEEKNVMKIVLAIVYQPMHWRLFHFISFYFIIYVQSSPFCRTDFFFMIFGAAFLPFSIISLPVHHFVFGVRIQFFLYFQERLVAIQWLLLSIRFLKTRQLKFVDEMEFRGILQKNASPEAMAILI